MKKNNRKILVVALFASFTTNIFSQDATPPFKTTLDFTIDNVGSAIVEVTNKYTASYWDYWTKAVGNNTSIINNSLKKVFPKYYLSDFQHSQDANERTNTVKFKIDGFMNINKNGKWEADLEKKDPDITKVSAREFLLVEEGTTMKIHLPPGTNDAKVEKNSFGKAILTYTPHSGGMGGTLLTVLGILIALGGVSLLIIGRMGSKSKPGANQPIQQTTLPQEKTQNPVFNEISKN